MPSPCEHERLRRQQRGSRGNRTDIKAAEDGSELPDVDPRDHPPEQEASDARFADGREGTLTERPSYAAARIATHRGTDVRVGAGNIMPPLLAVTVVVLDTLPVAGASSRRTMYCATVMAAYR